MRYTCLALLTLLAATALLAIAPANAKTCKEPTTVSYRTAIQASEATREKRARSGVLDKWRDRARADFGIVYRFWSRADNQSIECTATPKATTCKATATPCRLI